MCMYLCGMLMLDVSAVTCRDHKGAQNLWFVVF